MRVKDWMRRPVVALAVVALGAAASVAARPAGSGADGAYAAVPRPDHVVVVFFENKGYDNVMGSSDAPYLNELAARGANMTDSHGVTHPSQPNYLALFSGGTQGVTDDSCPHTFDADNLGAQALDAGVSYASYAESMPSDGYTGCTGNGGLYARKHAPWTDFSSVPADTQHTFDAFGTDYASLPQLSLVTPDMCSDMHDCSVSHGDTWARNNLDGYAQWAESHNSLLIVTFDEDEGTNDNRIPTIIVGQPVTPGTYSEHIDHYTMLRTLEDMYGLPALGTAADRDPVTDIWS